MNERRKLIIPPQRELEDEIRKLAHPGAAVGCPRCGEPGQRFLRRCPKCGRRSRTMRSRLTRRTRIPGHW